MKIRGTENFSMTPEADGNGLTGSGEEECL